MVNDELLIFLSNDEVGFLSETDNIDIQDESFGDCFQAVSQWCFFKYSEEIFNQKTEIKYNLK